MVWYPPVPVRQMGAELVITADISQAPESSAAGNEFQILLQTCSIMSKSIKTLELRGGERLLVRPALNGVPVADFAAPHRAIQARRTATLRRRQAIQAGPRPLSLSNWSKKSLVRDEALKGSLNLKVTKGPEETNGRKTKLICFPMHEFCQGFPLL